MRWRAGTLFVAFALGVLAGLVLLAATFPPAVL